MNTTLKTIVFVVLAGLLVWYGRDYGSRQNINIQVSNQNNEPVEVQGNTENLIMNNSEEAGGLGIEDVVVGTGAEAKSGDRVSVHYTGTFTDGRKFDSSVDRGTPFTFLLGAGQVIAGWDIGVKGMKVGGKRNLTIPPALGYGASGAGPIPPNTTLKFSVELLGVES